MKHLRVLCIALLTVHSYALRANSVTAEIAIGELIDKITILQIKQERITDSAKLKNICTELETLLCTYETQCKPSVQLEQLIDDLRAVNTILWDIEDAIRDKERDKKFDYEFIELARSVYHTNDKRCTIKRAINDLCGSRLCEEKSYKEYIVE